MFCKRTVLCLYILLRGLARTWQLCSEESVFRAWQVPRSYALSWELPSGKRLQKNAGKTQLLMGKLTISMAIFNSYVKLPEGIYLVPLAWAVCWAGFSVGVVRLRDRWHEAFWVDSLMNINCIKHEWHNTNITLKPIVTNYLDLLGRPWFTGHIDKWMETYNISSYNIYIPAGGDLWNGWKRKLWRLYSGRGSSLGRWLDIAGSHFTIHSWSFGCAAGFLWWTHSNFCSSLKSWEQSIWIRFLSP